MTIAILGAGAFGTALAIALARDGEDTTLWSRDPSEADVMERTRRSGKRLPDHALPDTLSVTSDLPDADISLLAIPTQKLSSALRELPLNSKTLIACCKGIDRSSGLGPVKLIEASRPDANAAILTGPSFAVDIAKGLPTALVLATREDDVASNLQKVLTRPALRIYRSTDVSGAELGGALKNVVALAAGMAIGAGLGDSARASIISRGFSEMSRFAQAKGAEPTTINGLSGLGDLVLTCTSEKSRNFSTGVLLGQGQSQSANTVEGLATARAVVEEAKRLRLEVPVISAVAEVIDGNLDIPGAIATLLSRPVGKE